MISIVLCNNISGFKPCRLCRRVLLDIHDLCRIITDKSYNDHGQNKCKNKIKYRSCCHNRDSRPDRGCIKRSRKLFLCGILTNHRTGTAQRQQFHRITCFSLLDAEQPWSHAKRKLCYTDSIYFGQKEMSQLMYQNDCTENDDRNQNLQFTTCFQSTDKSRFLLQEYPLTLDIRFFYVFP